MMGNSKEPRRYPFRSWENKSRRMFLIGFLGVIVAMGVVDRLFADFEYIRAVDSLMIASYGIFWLLLSWFRPDLFRDGV
jgi:hypothetical protein